MSFPLNLPIAPGSPAIAINKEGKVAVIEKELPIEALYVNRFDILFPGDKIERRICLVE